MADKYTNPNQRMRKMAANVSPKTGMTGHPDPQYVNNGMHCLEHRRKLI
jgi:hypothetical protein